MNILGVGTMELVFILIIALVVLGPAKAIDMARDLGKTIRFIQNGVSNLPKLIEEEPKDNGSKTEDG
jgi:sec-independent protein translocase protein TatB